MGHRAAPGRRGAGAEVRTLLAFLAAGPGYPADAADRRSVRIAGLVLPLRALIAIVVVTLVVLFDYTRAFIPGDVQALGRAPEAMRFQSLERLLLFGALPLLIVVWGFRDRPSHYGVRLGDWRVGLPLALVGCVAMTPVVAALLGMPDFRAYYAVAPAPLAERVLTNVLDLAPAEFLFRGFLMFSLLRAIGPLGIVVAQLPFVFAHLGKPEIELFSTLFGGSVYGWLDWRTGSILWSALAHVYIVTLVVSLATG